MSTRGSLIEILLHIYNVQQAEVIFGFLFTFITHKLWEHLVGVFTVSKYMYIQTFFNDYDVTTLKLFIQSYSKIIQSTQSKCCETKIISYKHGTFLSNRSPHSIWIFLYRMYFTRETFMRYKTNILCLAFNQAKESVSSEKCS